MKRWHKFSIIAFFVASIGLSATASHADEITAQQWVDAALGNTMIGKTSKGKRYKYFLKKGGSLVFNMESGFYDEGKWVIKDGKVCMQWEKLRGGKFYCIRDYEMNGDLFTNFNEAKGKRVGPYRIAKGKTAGFQDVKK